MTFPERGGAACPGELMQTTGCSLPPCSANDCLVGDWQAWSACSGSCGEGQRQRHREVLRARSPDGAGCSLELTQLRSCLGPPCPVQDCIWDLWSDWSGCSASCGGGQQDRSRNIALSPSRGGRLCQAYDKEEVRPCATQACSLPPCRDGLWAQWERWSECSVTCGGGLRHRTRQVARMADACGSPVVGDAREEKFCKSTSCEPTYDCVFSEWGGLERLLYDLQRAQEAHASNPAVWLWPRRLLQGSAEGDVALQPRPWRRHTRRVLRAAAGGLPA
eukprot:CAMPEP_0175293684 /NCGR_PEP_ID=MMETSP0093-20121207/57598_1 /TAXON_ID=311494 /ORGANISM="Alexandrium monilatum, Strain CCMP3105" /LENGTH=275 /DNA_ID=CAMNT_0016589573 /DNA_START=23 /DNA_END=845 /DNA_ORIENTATION=+